MHTRNWYRNIQEDYLEGIGVDWKIILKLTIETEWKGVDWIDLAQGRVRVFHTMRGVVTGCETLSFSRSALIPRVGYAAVKNKTNSVGWYDASQHESLQMETA
jgi:hypothetical protein